MNTFSIKRYTKEDFLQWNDFVARHHRATFLFHRDFMDYHSDRFVDHSLLVHRDNKLLAILPANHQGNSVYSHAGLSYGGVLISRKCNFSVGVNIYEALLKFLENEGIENLYIKGMPLIYNSSIDESEALIFNWLNADIERIDTYSYIDLQYFSGPNRNRSRALKVAKGKGLEVRISHDLETFWNNILKPNLRSRFGVNPVHSLDEISMLQERFHDQIQLFAAFHGNEMKAGAIIFVTDNVAHFQYSSGLDDRAEDGALDLLFSEVISNFSQKQYISFGSSMEKEGNAVNRGLLYWKESFDAKMAVQRFYHLQTKNHILLKNRLV
ncbi:GNAT family N-acetyltransferase [Sungkyunkwania multivorans]|uniref:GNAT family N-acetyltransferase n=1 Tax=Sungkyunkwania multivorans TaxID=1173618 RepID=A0ABW3CV12_9FLAO